MDIFRKILRVLMWIIAIAAFLVMVFIKDSLGIGIVLDSLFVVVLITRIILRLIFGRMESTYATSSYSSNDSCDDEEECEEETEEHYYLDDFAETEIYQSGSGASEHWRDGNGHLYKEDSCGNLVEVDDPFEDVS